MGFSRQEYWSGLPFPSPLLLVGEELLIIYLVDKFIKSLLSQGLFYFPISMEDFKHKKFIE